MIGDDFDLARGFQGLVRWPITRVCEIASLHYGKALTAGSRKPGDVPVYGSNGQCGWHDESLGSGPTVILGRKGQGPLGVEWCSGPFWVIDTAYYVSIDSSRVDLRYFYYLIKHVGLNHLKDGTSNPSLSRDVFGRQRVPLPPLPAQRCIVSVLSAYDDLIENNVRRIAILEQMARSIYEEWFVNFRFPGCEKVRMVDSELGPIPETFRFGVLADIASRIGASVNPSESPDEVFAHYSIPAFDADQQPVVERGKSIMSNKTLIGQDVVLVSKLNPRIPRVWNVVVDRSRRNLCSTELLAFTPKSPFTKEVLFLLLDSSAFQARYAGLAIGTSTSHQRVKPNDMDQIKVSIPPADLICRADSALSPMLSLARVLRMKNHNLRTTRNHLTAHLISGELDVSALREPEAAVA